MQLYAYGCKQLGYLVKVLIKYFDTGSNLPAIKIPVTI